MARFTYNIIIQEVSWDCPQCSYVNSFAVKEKPTILVCAGCGFSFLIDPIRYVQFEVMDKVVGDALVKCLGSQGIENFDRGE